MENDRTSQTGPDNQAQVNAPGTPTETTQPTGTVSSSQSNTPAVVGTNQPKKKRFERKTILIGLAILLIGGSAAAFFGYYLPNRPENVWRRALANTADGYDRMVEYGESNKDIKGIKAKGTLKAEGAMAADGSFEAVSYEGKSKSTSTFGFAGVRYNLETITTVPEGATSPDMYFRLTGVKGIGSLFADSPYANVGAVIEGLDNQWVFIDHTFFDQLLVSGGNNQEATFDQNDIFGIARAVGEVNREYLFSAKEDKRVFTIVQQVGKEERAGRSVYHYVVGYDKENLKQYVKALKDKLKETKVKDLAEVSGRTYDEYFDIEEMLEKIDKLEESESADVWVDMKTKLVRVARFTSKDNKENYVELKMPYNGGDEYPFILFTNSVDDAPSTTEIGFRINTSKNTAKLNLDSVTSGEGQDQKIKVAVNFEPNNEPVEVIIPDSTRSILELISALFGSLSAGEEPGTGSSGSSTPMDEVQL